MVRACDVIEGVVAWSLALAALLPAAAVKLRGGGGIAHFRICPSRRVVRACDVVVGECGRVMVVGGVGACV